MHESSRRSSLKLRRLLDLFCPTEPIAKRHFTRDESIGCGTKGFFSVVPGGPTLGSMKPIKLSELTDVLEFDSEERVNLIDLQNGRVVSVERRVLSAVEEGDEDALSALPKWQLEEVEIARAKAEDSGERFVAPPDKFEFHEYHHMERFIRTVEDDDAVDQLW